MFKSTDHFDKTVISILKNVRDYPDDHFTDGFTELTDLDVADAVKRAIDLGYLLGVSVKIGAQDDITYSGTPRLSYEGLLALEN